MHDEALRLGKQSVSFLKRVQSVSFLKRVQSVSFLKRVMSENHVFAVRAMYQVAIIYFCLDRFAEALIVFEKLLTLGCPDEILEFRKWIKDIQLRLSSEFSLVEV